jgi:hypothetical protein
MRAMASRNGAGVKSVAIIRPEQTPEKKHRDDQPENDEHHCFLSAALMPRLANPPSATYLLI